jgi:hypothetical protein
MNSLYNFNLYIKGNCYNKDKISGSLELFIYRFDLCAILMGNMRLSFIDSDLLYRGALSGRFDFVCKINIIYIIYSF